MTANGYGFSFWGDETIWNWRLYNSENVLNAPELFTFKWLMVNFVRESHLTLKKGKLTE